MVGLLILRRAQSLRREGRRPRGGAARWVGGERVPGVDEAVALAAEALGAILSGFEAEGGGLVDGKDYRAQALGHVRAMDRLGIERLGRYMRLRVACRIGCIVMVVAEAKVAACVISRRRIEGKRREADALRAARKGERGQRRCNKHCGSGAHCDT